MLNMRARWYAKLLLSVVLALSWSSASAQLAGVAAIDQPVGGEVLRGTIQINGTAAVSDFAVADLSFAYDGDRTNTWFTLAEIDRPIVGSLLATWDTTDISDGEYVLRLRVQGQGGTSLEDTVDVQVRNYTDPLLPTPTLTATPSSVAPVPTAMILPIMATPTPTPFLHVTPTPLQANPAAISQSAVYGNFAWGALAATAIGVILALVIFRQKE
jgi:hypothetical protein